MSTTRTVQNDQYWKQFAVQPSDLDYLTNFLVESERPQTLEKLAYELVSYRRHQMVELFEETLSQGRIYRPGEVYEIGERVIFPHLNNAVGEVTQVRTGHNPEYDPFSVIALKMDSGRDREFVVELTLDHPLNSATYMPSAEASVDEIYEQYGELIVQALQTALETNAQFLNVAHQWFLRDLLMEISPGQLNIAEALLDMADGGPLVTESLLAEMDLPDEISRPLQSFSLEYALLHDRRFDEVGPAGHASWYLRNMEPQEVLETPPNLHYMPIPYNRGLMDDGMLALEHHIDDEWAENPASLQDEGQDAPVTIVLTYPHWRSGTLPLASRVSRLFPTARITDRIRFTFVDGDSQEEFPGWVVRSGRYVYGLEEWYEGMGVGVGSYIDLEKGEESGRIIVNARPIHSNRREWLRTVTAENDQLAFEVTRVSVSCEFDELAAVAVPDPDSIDALAEEMKRLSMESLLEQAFSGLAGLSLQRAVHAVTLYSVMNLVRRVPPAPMLATLVVSSRYVSLGDNYWAYRGDEQ